MNTQFNITRFIDNLKFDFKISKKHYLIIAGTLIGMYLLALIFGYAGKWGSAEVIIRTLTPLVVAISIIVLPCILEQNLDKNTATLSFIRPISNLERFLTIFLKYIIIIPLICLIIVYIEDRITLLSGIDKQIFSYAYKSIDNYQYKGILESLTADQIHMIYGLQSIFILGYLYFRKYAIFKIGLIVLLCTLSMPVVSSFSAQLFTGEEFSNDFSSLLSPLSYVNEYTSTAHWTISISDILIKIVSPFLLWIVAYFKLKETEI